MDPTKLAENVAALLREAGFEEITSDRDRSGVTVAGGHGQSRAVFHWFEQLPEAEPGPGPVTGGRRVDPEPDLPDVAVAFTMPDTDDLGTSAPELERLLRDPEITRRLADIAATSEENGAERNL